MSKYALMEGMAVDLEALLSLVHCCRPELCKTTNCCCATYDVEISLYELVNISGYLQVAAGFGNGGAQGLGAENLFEDQGKNCYLIETREDESCLLSYKGDQGQALCSLHSAALRLDIAPAEIKPKCCMLWPLSLEEGDIPILGVHSDAFIFPCNRERMAGPRKLDAGVSEILESIWGTGFARKVQRAVYKILK